MSCIRISNKNGVTLGELRSYIEKCKELPDETPIIISLYEETEEISVVDIQGDKDSIIFYNWF